MSFNIGGTANQQGSMIGSNYIVNIIELQKNKVEEQKQQVEQQKQLVEEKQKEILDSIHYAKRIQQSQLPNEQYIEKTLKRLNN